MSLSKVTYQDGQTVIYAQNLNDIQDEIIDQGVAKYEKPNTGIPKTDLASAVQTSLGKADTALQSVPSTYRTAAAQDMIDAGKETAGLGLTGAAVGDLVRVKTVDGSGKPTSWENMQLSDISRYANNWTGKHLLIIGDSWSRGWTGSAYVERPWCDVMVSILGCTADFIRQGGGGFTHKASDIAGNTYPGKDFVEVLDFVKDNKYDAIVVQTGWNDIQNNDATDNDLATAIYNFATNANNYFDKTTIYLLPSYPAYLMPYARLSRAETLIRVAYYHGIVVCHYSLNWLFTNKNYRGTDVPHPNQSGYSYWGRLAASFLRGWDGKEIKGEQSWFSVAGTISGDNNIIISPTINTTDIQSSAQFYIRMSNGTVSVYAMFRTNADFPTTVSTNITLVEGLPLPIVQSQYLNVQFRDVQTTKRVPRCSLTYDGKLVLTTTGDCSDAVVIVYGSYQTRSNCIM